MKIPVPILSTLRNKKLSIPLGISVLAITAFIVSTAPDSSAIATSDVKRGEFAVSITVSGEIRAMNSFTLVTPRTRYGNLQVVYLIPEGTIVKAGDVVVRFATTEVDKGITDKENDLAIQKGDFAKLEADQSLQMSDLEGQLKNAELGLEQSKLQVEKMKFEADVIRKDAEINLQRAQITFDQAQRKIASKKISDKSDRNKSLLKMKQTESDLARARTEKEQFTLKAPMPGLAVLEMNWQSGRKIAIGDSPWPGMSMVSLPDLSQMQVITNVNEVDVSKVKKDQIGKVKLDAFPDRVFKASVFSVGTIGQQRDRSSNIKTFEVILSIDGSDPILKPGMTTSNEVVMQTIPDAIFVPLESVFEKEGKLVVYRMNGSSPQPQLVQVGAKNSNFIVITDGLKEGEKVTLRDPSLKDKTSSKDTKPKEARM
jgi:RND family efflux transporter MFP subunit